MADPKTISPTYAPITKDPKTGISTQAIDSDGNRQEVDPPKPKAKKKKSKIQTLYDSDSDSGDN